MPYTITNIPDSLTKSLAGGSCVIPLSIHVDGTKNCFGENVEQQILRLTALFKYLQLANVKKLLFVLVDTLQVHTLRNKQEDPTDGVNDSINVARLRIISRNLSQIVKQIATENLSHAIPEIKFWDDFVSGEFAHIYEKCFAQIHDLYLHNNSYQNAILVSAFKFMSCREHNSKCLLTNVMDVLRNDIEYLLEEAAVLVLWRRLGYKWIIYPAEITEALKETILIMSDNENIGYIKPGFRQIKLVDKPDSHIENEQKYDGNAPAALGTATIIKENLSLFRDHRNTSTPTKTVAEHSSSDNEVVSCKSGLPCQESKI